jgi:hypothetical protein
MRSLKRTLLIRFPIMCDQRMRTINELCFLHKDIISFKFALDSYSVSSVAQVVAFE